MYRSSLRSQFWVDVDATSPSQWFCHLIKGCADLHLGEVSAPGTEEAATCCWHCCNRRTQREWCVSASVCVVARVTSTRTELCLTSPPRHERPSTSLSNVASLSVFNRLNLFFPGNLKKKKKSTNHTVCLPSGSLSNDGKHFDTHIH